MKQAYGKSQRTAEKTWRQDYFVVIVQFPAQGHRARLFQVETFQVERRRGKAIVSRKRMELMMLLESFIWGAGGT